ncbi:hypothetical protein Pla175_04790 [Pirellulimonas nuda]|uniref:Ice-binding protein C-terminal domain-containing protein n=1 Tax=Pirellulimonas nuda TaxID=2528009 RepID=A0A518D6K9_9BACT|nr:PEP-CTERM sorting domain-containing protein [Pirellulimonas nuda]QDU87123.1 hypothetical protein Pla175_04790 [Pirellulimonas nuda]
MSWKSLTCAAALAAMVSPVLAVPNVVATNPTLSGSNYSWSIGVDPDDALYGANPGGGANGGSVAIEWTLSSTGLSAAAKNAANFPNDNPGMSGPDGVSPVAAGAATVNLGSTFLTGAGTFEAVTLTVPGPTITTGGLGNSHVSTVNVGGVYSAAGPPLAVGGTRGLIAQAGANSLLDAGKKFQYQVFGGDANFSGGATPVNSIDLTIFGSNFNKPGTYTWAQGNFTGSAAVDSADLTVFGANFNKVLTAFVIPPAAVGGAIGGAGVPEPGSMVLAGLASIGLIAAARRNKK